MMKSRLAFTREGIFAVLAVTEQKVTGDEISRHFHDALIF